MTQEAFAVAAERWPRDGMPPNPGAWLTITARNRAIDRIRRDAKLAEKTKVPAGALQIDGRGKYLMPGLADMHVHLFPGTGQDDLANQQFQLFLANGVTTIRNMIGKQERVLDPRSGCLH